MAFLGIRFIVVIVFLSLGTLSTLRWLCIETFDSSVAFALVSLVLTYILTVNVYLTSSLAENLKFSDNS